MPSIEMPYSSKDLQRGAEMYNLHCAYSKHEYSRVLTHAHYGLGAVYIKACMGCGAFKIWIGNKEARKKYQHGDQEKADWTPAYKMAIDKESEPCLDAAIQETGDGELITMWEEYVKACRQGKYVPPGDK